MTDLDLDLTAIKKRIEAASAGPWTAASDGLVWAPRLGDPVSGSTEQEDAKFIAAARQDVPALVAELERLQRLLVADPVPSESAYERMAQALADERAALAEAVQALTDERAEVVRHCDKIAALEADRRHLLLLVTEVLGSFAQMGTEHMAYATVRIETLARWTVARGAL